MSETNKKILPILTVISVLAFLSALPLANAVDYWDNAINLYPKSTTRWDGVREIENGGSYSLDIQVQYYSSTNITVFKSYYLRGNGTTFVAIENGVVIKSRDTKRIQPAQKLVFDIEATPIDSVTVGQTASVTVEITRTEVPLVTGPSSTIFPRFDFTLIKFPGYLLALPIFDRTFQVDFTVFNKGSLGTEATIAYWLVNTEDTTIYRETLSLYLHGKESREITLTILIPRDPGEYTLYIKAIKPAGVEGETQRTFTVYSLGEWLLTEGIIIVILILAAIGTVIALLIKKYVLW